MPRFGDVGARKAPTGVAKALAQAAAGLFAVVFMAGCASTKVTSSHPYEGGPLPRPDRIIVENFAATAGDVAPESNLVGAGAEPAAQTPEDEAAGRQLGAEIARQLTLDLQNVGLPAVQAAGQPPPRPGDVVITGTFLSVDQGSAAKRVLIGFSSGTADLQTAVEVFEMTPQGLRPLAGGTTASEGARTPGLVAPALVFAATKNPVGLIVVGAMKLHGEASGSNTVGGDAKRTADAIAERFKAAAQRQGWI